MDHWQLLFDNNTTSNEDTSNTIPTMVSIAIKVAREDVTKLHQKKLSHMSQYAPHFYSS